jgi:quinol monooxygenase YgiN
MYAAIRQVKAKSGTADELAARVKRGAIPIISNVPGFLGYYVVYSPDDTVTAISVFNSVEGAQESNERALDWIDKNLGPLLVESVTATAGPVIAHSLPSRLTGSRRDGRFGKLRAGPVYPTRPQSGPRMY